VGVSSGASCGGVLVAGAVSVVMHRDCQLLGPGPNNVGYLNICVVDNEIKWHPSDTPDGHWLVVSLECAYQLLAASGLDNAYDLYRRQ
jgi:hypothetical protein